MELYTKALENNQLPQDFKPQPYLTLALLPATIEFKLTVLGSATRSEDLALSERHRR